MKTPRPPKFLTLTLISKTKNPGLMLLPAGTKISKINFPNKIESMKMFLHIKILGSNKCLCRIELILRFRRIILMLIDLKILAGQPSKIKVRSNNKISSIYLSISRINNFKIKRGLDRQTKIFRILKIFMNVLLRLPKPLTMKMIRNNFGNPILN